MRDYIGKYRVVSEFDVDGNTSGEFTHIPVVGSFEGMLYRIGEKVLCLQLLTSARTKVWQRCERANLTPISADSTDCEILLHFDEGDIDKIHLAFGLKVLGKDINPSSILNNPCKDVIRQKIRDDMSDAQKEVLRLRGIALSSRRETHKNDPI
jgi:hypothetical protein